MPCPPTTARWRLPLRWVPLLPCHPLPLQDGHLCLHRPGRSLRPSEGDGAAARREASGDAIRPQLLHCRRIAPPSLAQTTARRGVGGPGASVHPETAAAKYGDGLSVGRRQAPNGPRLRGQRQHRGQRRAAPPPLSHAWGRGLPVGARGSLPKQVVDPCPGTGGSGGVPPPWPMSALPPRLPTRPPFRRPAGRRCPVGPGSKGQETSRVRHTPPQRGEPPNGDLPARD